MEVTPQAAPGVGRRSTGVAGSGLGTRTSCCNRRPGSTPWTIRSRRWSAAGSGWGLLPREGELCHRPPRSPGSICRHPIPDGAKSDPDRLRIIQRTWRASSKVMADTCRVFHFECCREHLSPRVSHPMSECRALIAAWTARGALPPADGGCWSGGGDDRPQPAVDSARE